MEKLAKKAAEQMLLKIAGYDERGRAYPISRLATTTADVSSLGIANALYARAAQGRANLGREGATKAEDLKLRAVENEYDGRTYPISRALTDPNLSGIVGAITGVGGAAAASQGIPRALVAGGLSGAGGYLSANLARDIYARSDIGKANVGREGYGPTKKRQLALLKEKGVDSGPTIHKQMDTDTGKGLIYSTGVGLASLI